jgi:hypothetical protein
VPICINEIIIKDGFPLCVEGFPMTMSEKCSIRAFTANPFSEKIFE